MLDRARAAARFSAGVSNCNAVQRHTSTQERAMKEGVKWKLTRQEHARMQSDEQCSVLVGLSIGTWRAREVTVCTSANTEGTPCYSPGIPWGRYCEHTTQEQGAVEPDGRGGARGKNTQHSKCS